MVSNIKDKKEVRARLGKRTVKESMRESLWNLCRKMLQK